MSDVVIREELQKLHGQRRRFKAKVLKFGKKTFVNRFNGKVFNQTTILLANVVDIATDREVSDHCWVTVGKRFAELHLQEQDNVSFKARVTSYRKFHRDEEGCRENSFHYSDYRLSFPTDLAKQAAQGCVSPSASNVLPLLPVAVGASQEHCPSEKTASEKQVTLLSFVVGEC